MPTDHDLECDALNYEGGLCTCGPDFARSRSYEPPTNGEEHDPHDGRIAGPPVDW